MKPAPFRYARPSTLPEAIALHVRMGALTNPQVRCAGISFNTSAMKPSEAERLMQQATRELGLPVADPMRGGPAFERLVESCLA